MPAAAKLTPVVGTSNLKRVVDNTVRTTKDYQIFKRITGNRIINATHVNRLKESMQKHDLMIPIIVNENMEVIDGQHRLQARTELGIIVYYVVISGLSIEDTQKANANNKNWTGEDFLNYYCERNYYAYKEFKKFKEKFKFSMQVSMGLLAGQTMGNAEFNEGQLMLRPDTIEKAERTAFCLYSIEPYYKGFKRRSFVFAMAKLLNNEQFDFDEFMNKLSYQSSKMVDCVNIEQYIRIIEDIYNYKRKQEDKIRFI